MVKTREKRRKQMKIKCGISYNKLWKLLIDRKLKKKDLREATHLSPSVIAKMGRNEPVNLETLALICRFLKCQIGDIVEISPA